MAGFGKLIKRAPGMDSMELKKALKKQREKLEQGGKIHGAMYTATKFGTNALLSAASKHSPQLGPIPIGPDTAVAGVAGVVAFLSKGKRARAAAAIAEGACHALIGRLIHTDVIIPLGKAASSEDDDSRSSSSAGDDAVTKAAKLGATLVEEVVTRRHAKSADDEDLGDLDEEAA